MAKGKTAAIMAAAAMVASTLTSGGARAEGSAPSADPPKKASKEKGSKAEQKRPVKPVAAAKKRPVERDPDVGMPAGTAYDVMRHGDVP